MTSYALILEDGRKTDDLIPMFVLIGRYKLNIDRNLVIFNGYEVTKEAFVERGGDFMGRELPSVWKYVGYDDGG